MGFWDLYGEKLHSYGVTVKTGGAPVHIFRLLYSSQCRAITVPTINTSTIQQYYMEDFIICIEHNLIVIILLMYYIFGLRI